MIHNFAQRDKYDTKSDLLSPQERVDYLKSFFENKWIEYLRASNNILSYTDMVAIAQAMKTDQEAINLYDDGKIPRIIAKSLNKCIKICKPPLFPVISSVIKLICICGWVIGAIFIAGGIIEIYQPVSVVEGVQHWFSGGLQGGKDSVNMCIYGAGIIFVSYIIFRMKWNKDHKNARCREIVSKAIDQWGEQLTKTRS